MPKYIAFFTFKPEALARMTENPQDREAAVRELVESAGGTLEAYYVMFGPHDGFIICDAPGSVDAGAVSVVAASSGAFSHIETHEVLSSEQFREALAKAKGLTFRPPGA